MRPGLKLQEEYQEFCMNLDFIESIIPKEYFQLSQSGTALERAQDLLRQCHPGHTHMQLLELDG